MAALPRANRPPTEVLPGEDGSAAVLGGSSVDPIRDLALWRLTTMVCSNHASMYGCKG